MKPANRLAGESSPYLLQHAHNPVDWYPWGEEAFEEARRRDKPVFPVHRLLDLPLVSCHGARILRGRGCRPSPQRGLRLRQGRSGGTPRSRSALHGRLPGPDRIGRLAPDDRDDAGQAPVLRRDIFSQVATLGPARPARARAPHRRSLADATGRGPAFGRRHPGRPGERSGREPEHGGRNPAVGGRPRRRLRRAGRRFRLRPRRLRQRAQVPHAPPDRTSS